MAFSLNCCCCSLVTQSCPALWTPWPTAYQASLSSTISQSLFRLMDIELMMLSNHLILLPLPSSPAFNLSQHQGIFQWVGTSHQVARVLELQLQHQSFQWILRVDFLMIDWFDLLPVQGTLPRVFSRTTVWKHPFFSAQPSLWSNFHISAWLLEKNIVLPVKTFVNNVMSLLFNILSKFVIGFLPRSKHLLISWLQSPSAVILEPKTIKSVTASTFPPSICQRCHQMPWY